MKTIGLGIKSSREWRKTMRIEKERMEKKLNKIGYATIVIFIITCVEFIMASIFAATGLFPEKIFQINEICVYVIMGIFVLMMIW